MPLTGDGRNRITVVVVALSSRPRVLFPLPFLYTSVIDIYSVMLTIVSSFAAATQNAVLHDEHFYRDATATEPAVHQLVHS